MGDTDWEKIREQNMKEMQLFLEEELAKPDMQEVLQDIQNIQNINQPPEKKAKKRSSNKDEPFHFFGSIPTERRSSSRLAKRKPEYTLEDLSDVEEDIRGTKLKKIMNEHIDVEKIEEVVFRPKLSHRSFSKRRSYVPFVAAEDISESYIKNIAWRVQSKTHSENGTSCHQCRQKTSDSKTYCRSGRCTGVRGQFCGVCLKNRYGEDVAVALKDPKWACPPCRNLCNCSICRTRQGKRPTGILAPVAHNSGFKSVADFLKHLQTGDNPIEPIDEKKPKRIEGDLLGFNSDDEPVIDSEIENVSHN